jgi:hypothetical protein
MRGQDVLRAVFELRTVILCRLALRKREAAGFEPVSAVEAVGRPDFLPAHIAAMVTLAAGDGFLDLLEAKDDLEPIVRLTPLGWAEGKRLLALDEWAGEQGLSRCHE